jgi:hypothetical protein
MNTEEATVEKVKRYGVIGVSARRIIVDLAVPRGADREPRRSHAVRSRHRDSARKRESHSSLEHGGSRNC